MSHDEKDIATGIPLLLDEQLCFNLYSASRAVTLAYRPLLEDLGLTYTQYAAMLVVWQHDSLTMKQLGTALDLDYGTVTPLVKRLETDGLVERRRRSDDERSVDVCLTPAGRALRDRAAGVPDRMAQLMQLDRSDADALADLLDQLRANLAPHASRSR